MTRATQTKATTVEATVTSKGQVTLPRELRKRLGIQRGSRIRFSIPTSGAVKVEPVLYDLEDLWKMADEGGQASGVMTFDEMDAAKAWRRW
ncbi:MAG: AbrB/MazE/SpoVT family DNA-binding domain-containing protein [Acidobacteriota bacterium]|nr:AbrB/MazE/SpoVT family DNA-binding domain-containing protein [Acidobacteriota bacterium]MDE3163266.1 AbrB/MazE/SpoVT family DNA-binding domain-containing protein [Acidobacteriota bacterium]